MLYIFMFKSFKVVIKMKFFMFDESIRVECCNSGEYKDGMWW